LNFPGCCFVNTLLIIDSVIKDSIPDVNPETAGDGVTGDGVTGDGVTGDGFTGGVVVH
jgi:hypothetical protein